jgi:ABC-2 type transport system permease protein
MNTAIKTAVQLTDGIAPAVWSELQKVRRSKIVWITIFAFLFLSLIDGLFMFILKDPELARRLGLIGAKAQIIGGSADWPSMFNLSLILTSVGSLIIFGFIFVWIFGREFSDKTVYNMLSLPVSRVSIVAAKIIIAICWALMLALSICILILVIGAVLQLPDGSSSIISGGVEHILITCLLTILLCIPFALAASISRSYLPAIGCIFLVLILSEIFNTLGYGQFFPWAVPMLYSGAAEALTGGDFTPLGTVSYILVGLRCLLSIIITGAWWHYADQT